MELSTTVSLVFIQCLYANTIKIDYQLTLYASSPPLPWKIQRSVIGYDVVYDKLWLIGGWFQNGHLTDSVFSYSFLTNQWTNDAVFHVNDALILESESYCQIDNILYWYNQPTNTIQSFNMTIGNINGYNDYYTNIPFYSNDNAKRTCLTSDGIHHIFLLDNDKSFYIYDMYLQKWYEGPSMINIYQSISCKYINHSIFVFGSYNIEYTQQLNDFDITKWSQWYTDTIKDNGDFRANSYKRTIVFNDSIIYVIGTIETNNLFSPQIRIFEPYKLELYTPQIVHYNTSNGDIFGSVIIAKNRLYYVGGTTPKYRFSENIWGYSNELIKWNPSSWNFSILSTNFTPLYSTTSSSTKFYTTTKNTVIGNISSSKPNQMKLFTIISIICSLLLCIIVYCIFARKKKKYKHELQRRNDIGSRQVEVEVDEIEAQKARNRIERKQNEFIDPPITNINLNT
eukprot:308333_1